MSKAKELLNLIEEKDSLESKNENHEVILQKNGVDFEDFQKIAVSIAEQTNASDVKVSSTGELCTGVLTYPDDVWEESKIQVVIQKEIEASGSEISFQFGS